MFLIILVIVLILFVMFTKKGKNIFHEILKKLKLKEDFSSFESYNECKKAGHTDTFCSYASATPPYHTGINHRFDEGQFNYHNTN